MKEFMKKKLIYKNSKFKQIYGKKKLIKLKETVKMTSLSY